MRHRTAAVLFASAAATGAAVVGSVTATLLAADADARVDRAYRAMSAVMLTRPDEPGPGPRLVLVRQSPPSDR